VTSSSTEGEGLGWGGELDVVRSPAALKARAFRAVMARYAVQRSGVLERMALTTQVGLGQAGVDLLYRFGGPDFIQRMWDRSYAPDLWGDILVMDLASARWAAPQPWWGHLLELERIRVATRQQGVPQVDPEWAEPPAPWFNEPMRLDLITDLLGATNEVVFMDMVKIPNPTAELHRVRDCPECAAGKHGNCDGSAWCTVCDHPEACPCYQGDHL
jgi:hypothetical protein